MRILWEFGANSGRLSTPAGIVSRRQPVGGWDRDKPKAFVVFSFVVPATALETSDATLHCMNTCEHRAAFAAGIEVSTLEADALQWKIVAPRLVWDAEITAGLAPLNAVRGDFAASGAMLCNEMRKLVAQGSLNLGWRDFDKLRIERDRLGPPACEAHRRSKPRVPFDGHLEAIAARPAQKLATELFKENVALEEPLSGLRAGIYGVGKKPQMAENRFSEVEHSELVLFHHAAMG
jgi:hypothetical protein